MTKKNDKPKRKLDKVKVAATVVYTIIGIGVIGLVVGLFLTFTMLKDKPDLNVDEFVSKQSSQIYDRNGELISEIGSVKRQNVSYDDLPNNLIDAFVAVEDSRFFTHPGFDISRFSKAILENLKSRSFAQGGSTFTMQLVKNTYFVDDEAAIGASKSVERKVQEIALSLELEKNVNKKTIFELYLNKLNFGGSGNIRGIQKAAQYYYGKDVQDLTLPESALLAGVINAPNAFNPHNNLEKATNRRNQVLYLMNYHGYISDLEYETAKAVKVEDLLVDPYAKRHNGEGTPYQAYIDEVIAETIRLTGYDPTVTPMKIYTSMDPNVQSIMDDIQAENVEGYFEYPDELFELASICIDNSNGEITGILGGRSYADGGQLLLNHATEQFNQPGSTIKPMLDYALAFENLGWATSHVMVDKPLVWAGTDFVIQNANGRYEGQVTLKDAVGNSLNTPAIQALQEVIDKKTSPYVVEYLNNIGFDQVTAEDFNVQYAIGGSTLAVSVKQLASAQSTLLNGGVHMPAHTIRQIEFMNGKEPVIPTYNGTQALSEEAAYLTTELLYNNVYGDYANLMQILRDDYAVYAKTGTTDWGKAGVPYGIPVGAAKDGWMLGSTSEYTTCTWIGYDRAIKDQDTYLSNNKYLRNIQGKVTNMLLDATVASNGKPERVTRPQGIAEIKHILGTFPYVSPIEGMDEKYIATGLIKAKDMKLINPEEIHIESFSGEMKASLNPITSDISLTWPKYPDESKLKVAEEEMDVSLKRADGSVIVEAKGKRLFDYSWVYGPIRYKADIKRTNALGNLVSETTISSETESKVEKIDYTFGDKIEVCGYYAYDNKDVKSNKSCIEITIKDEEISLIVPDKTKSLNEIKKWADNLMLKLTYETVATADSSLIGKSVITDEKGNEINGQTLSMKQSAIANAKWKCTTYTQENIDLNIASRENPVAGNEITFDVTSNVELDSNFFIWHFTTDLSSDPEIKTGSNSVKYQIPVDATKLKVKVTYSEGARVAEKTIDLDIIKLDTPDAQE